jgi:chromosome partitioning protein
MPTVIVFGNEKGGTGKSTLAIHVAVALARSGLSVLAVDADVRQGSFQRFLSNRSTFAERHAAEPMPSPICLDTTEWVGYSSHQLADALTVRPEDVIVIDTPGAHTSFAERLHGCADLIITPLNDSLIDVSVIAEVDPDSTAIMRPSHYAEAVWKARQTRAAHDGGSISWIVLRNRLSALDAHNKRLMADVLTKAADRLGFISGPGFGERVIFRELFLQGLTLSDFEGRPEGLAWSMSHVAARQELRDLLDLVETGLTSTKAAVGAET